MLNRFQFARLRAFRFGGKKDSGRDRRKTGTTGVSDGHGSHSAVGEADRRPGSGGDIRDAWEDDDRVARLLERRRAEQEEERRQVLDRLGRLKDPAGQPGSGVDSGTGEGPEANPAQGGAPSPTHPLTGQSAPGQSAPGESSAGRPGAGDRNGGTARTVPVGRNAPVAPERRADARTTHVPALEPRPAAPHANGNGNGTLGRGSDTLEQGDRVHAPRQDAGAAASARVLCIASGKGGTGKSVMASNLALLRAKQGERVLLIDFDAGLANAHLLLGLAPPYDVGHVMEGEVSAKDALVEGPHGLKLLAGGVGRQTMIDPTRRELDRLFKALRSLESEFDLIIIDHGAGLSYSTVAHLAATSTLILVTNHEVTALSDGYALYKRAHMVNHRIRVGFVVNRAPDERIALDAWERFRGAAHKFLGHTPEWIGWVPADPAIPQAVQMRSPAVLSFPDSPAAQAFTRVASWPPIDHARSASPFYEKARRALR